MSFHYPLPESEPQSPLRGLSDETRTALTHVAMGPSAANLLLNSEGNSGTEQDPSFRPIVESAIDRARQLFSEIYATKLEIPKIGGSELLVNWQQLQAGYEAWDKLGLQPELIISPEGRPLAFWQALYTGIREWQEINHPDTIYKLQNHSDGDGLWINDQVKTHWDALTRTDKPRWGVSVMPTTIKAPVLAVDHRGNDKTNAMPARLISILSDLSEATTRSGENGLLHPTMERYLTLQASRLILGQSLVDDKVGSTYYYSWLDGTFTNTDGKLAAPHGYWYPDYGQVSLYWFGVGYRRGYLGSRPEVRELEF
jgi:hypothetical protein